MFFFFPNKKINNKSSCDSLDFSNKELHLKFSHQRLLYTEYLPYELPVVYTGVPGSINKTTLRITDYKPKEIVDKLISCRLTCNKYCVVGYYGYNIKNNVLIVGIDSFDDLVWTSRLCNHSLPRWLDLAWRKYKEPDVEKIAHEEYESSCKLDENQPRIIINKNCISKLK